MFGNKPLRFLVKLEVEVGNGENIFPDFAALGKERPTRPQDVSA
jgi:hypothetical protein